MNSTPSIGYLINKPSLYWWETFAAAFLTEQGWMLTSAESIKPAKSLGFDTSTSNTRQDLTLMDYLLDECSVALTYIGTDYPSSIFNARVDPSPSKQPVSLIDDLLAFISIYSGVYCKFLLKESHGSIWLQPPQDPADGPPSWAGPLKGGIGLFRKALEEVPALPQEQLRLALRWFFSGLKEFGDGRPIVEAALNWVCLEAQANILGLGRQITGKNKKFRMVEQLLKNLGFSHVPLLWDMYRLRNDAFHDGELSHLAEADAQRARTAVRFLVRAQILVLLGMNHSDFDPQFVSNYT